MSSAFAHRRIRAPIDLVWAAATDVAGACERMSGVERIELLTRGPFGVGSRWRETRVAVGSTAATEEVVVVECDPPRRFAVDATSRGAVFHTESTFAARGPAETEVRVVLDGEPPNVAGRLVGALLGTLAARAVLATLNRDLDDLARWCERPRRS
jgi:hypothetical protein